MHACFALQRVFQEKLPVGVDSRATSPVFLVRGNFAFASVIRGHDLGGRPRRQGVDRALPPKVHCLLCMRVRHACPFFSVVVSTKTIAEGCAGVLKGIAYSWASVDVNARPRCGHHLFCRVRQEHGDRIPFASRLAEPQ